MKLLNELLNLSEAAKGTTLVGLRVYGSNSGFSDVGKIITVDTKDEIWTGNFYCDIKDNLVSLEGAPWKVTGNFFCSNNPKLISLEGGPKEVGGDFRCLNNPKLISLKGAPKEVGQGGKGGDFWCTAIPKITSLKDIHKQVTNLNGKFYATNTPIKSHVLGLLLIKGCIGVKLDNKEVEAILNKYLPNTRGNKAVIDCQSELLDADLDDFAEL